MTRGGNRQRVTSFIDHPLEIDLQKPFTFLAWCYSSDTLDFRTIFSFKSPMCHSSLLCIGLLPEGSQIFFGYMLNAQHHVNAAVDAYVPSLAWFHFAFVLLDAITISLYVNGVQQPASLVDSLFNPGQVEYPIYLCSGSLFKFIATEANCSWAEYI